MYNSCKFDKDEHTPCFSFERIRWNNNKRTNLQLLTCFSISKY